MAAEWYVPSAYCVVGPGDSDGPTLTLQNLEVSFAHSMRKQLLVVCGNLFVCACKKGGRSGRGSASALTKELSTRGLNIAEFETCVWKHNFWGEAFSGRVDC
jgi:hypothetical protein